MWRKRQIMIHTDEDDEFERIERESKMKGQPYHWEADAIKAAVLIEREECARLCDEFPDVGYIDKKLTSDYHAHLIRQRGQA
jgi:hypothetical protein